MKKRYEAKGLKVVSIHLTLHDENSVQDVAAVREFVAAAGITYPVAVDMQGESWERFEFSYIPLLPSFESHFRFTERASSADI